MWLKELFDPAVKCERVGHKTRTLTRKTIRWPSESWRRGVADKCKEKLVKCRRCGEVLVDWEVTDRVGLHSLEMNSGMWDNLKEHGLIAD